MKSDKLFTFSFDRATGGQKVHNVGKGRITGLMIFANDISEHHKITVKVRGQEKTVLSCNQMPMALIGEYSDLKRGYNYRKGVASVFKQIQDELIEKLTGFTGSTTVQKASAVAPIYLDLGHVDTSSQNVEIMIDAPALGGDSIPMVFDVFTYHGEKQPDHIIQYDFTKSMDSVHNNVLALYYRSYKEYVKASGEILDYSFQLDTDNGTSLLDSRSVISQTNLFNNVEYPELQLGQLFEDSEPIPGTVRVKVGGNDVDSDDILMIVRKIYPKEVSDSTENHLKELVSKVESLERSNSELAKRMRHAGEIASSEELAQALEVVRNGKESEEN